MGAVIVQERVDIWVLLVSICSQPKMWPLRKIWLTNYLALNWNGTCISCSYTKNDNSTVSWFVPDANTLHKMRLWGITFKYSEQSPFYKLYSTCPPWLQWCVIWSLWYSQMFEFFSFTARPFLQKKVHQINIFFSSLFFLRWNFQVIFSAVHT